MEKTKIERIVELNAKIQQFAQATEMLKHFFEVMDFEEESLPLLKTKVKLYVEDMLPVLGQFKGEIAEVFPPKTSERLIKEIDESFRNLVNWLA